MELTTRFGPFIPDVPPFGSEGSNLVRNVLPGRNGYRPARRVAPFTEPLLVPALAARFAKSSSNAVSGFAATADTIHRITGASFEDASRSGGYNTEEGGNWDFVQFGDTLFATNYADPIQQFSLSGSTAFADIEGDAPRARYMAPVKNFLALGYLNDKGTIKPSGVRWSSNNNPSNFPAPGSDDAIQTLAGEQVLATDYGDVTGLEGGLTSADAVIFQETAVWRMAFTQGRLVFAFDLIEGARGCNAPGSIVQVGGQVFYLDDNGIYLTDGASSTPIGSSQVDEFLYKNINTLRLANVRAGVDIRRKQMLWSFPPTGEDVSTLTLVYDFGINEWSFLDGLTVQTFTRTLTAGVTLEDLNAIAASIEDLPTSLDSDIWKGGGLPVFSAFDESNRLGTLEGTTLNATMRTPEAELAPDQRTYVQFTRPLVDTDTVRVRPVTRETLQAPPAEGKFAALQADGRCVHRKTAKYWALDADIPAGAEWTVCQGVQVIHEPVAVRAPAPGTPAAVDTPYMLTSAGLFVLTDEGRLGTIVDQPPPEAVVFVLITSDGKSLVTSDGFAIRLSGAP